MKAVLYTGCTSEGLTVDGVRIETREQEVALLERLIPLLRQHIAANTMQVTQVLNLFQYDDFSMGETCDQCFDSPSTTTWNL